ncbi:hypothetical protein GCM10010515_11560 [Streptomyces fructofermentans]|uniref:GtrA-like protein domain-containing protein n=1 Tax=Streptomyces fructofermentans TaxID=152141 RepID=A0A918N817_9ACTN|nr:hypothetical protein GCM10010515_11560 [Streptomyces fructofermentans]
MAPGTAAPGPLASFVRFVVCGGGVGVLSGAAVALLAGLMPWSAANALVTVASTALCTELHALFTFGTGRRAGWRRHWQSAGSATAAYAVTSLAMLALHLVRSSPGALTEQAVYLGAAGLAGTGRFLVLRMFVFAGDRDGAAATGARDLAAGLPGPGTGTLPRVPVPASPRVPVLASVCASPSVPVGASRPAHGPGRPRGSGPAAVRTGPRAPVSRSPRPTSLPPSRPVLFPPSRPVLFPPSRPASHGLGGGPACGPGGRRHPGGASAGRAAPARLTAGTRVAGRRTGRCREAGAVPDGPRRPYRAAVRPPHGRVPLAPVALAPAPLATASAG